MKRWMALLLALCLSPWTGLAEQSTYLSPEALLTLEPAFESFLREMAAELAREGLLEESEQEEWVMRQLGDYFQNGGYGSIVIDYTPGVLANADDTVSLHRISVEIDAGTVTLDTLRRYSATYSSLPGLPLEVEVVDAQGDLVPCRIRWTATDGTFLIWDGVRNDIVDVGNSYVGEGRLVYWQAEPYEGIEEALTLNVFNEEESEVLGTVAFFVFADADSWILEVEP